MVQGCMLLTAEKEQSRTVTSTSQKSVAAPLRINLKLDGAPIPSRAYTHPTLLHQLSPHLHCTRPSHSPPPCCANSTPTPTLSSSSPGYTDHFHSSCTRLRLLRYVKHTSKESAFLLTSNPLTSRAAKASGGVTLSCLHI